MMAKITKGGSFSITANYIVDSKKLTQIITCEGLRMKDMQSIVESFEMQASMNPRISKMAGHISLNFSKHDKERLSNEMMTKIAIEYMTKMNIVNTQYLIGRHFDKEHPHIHILYNRVDNNGRMIADKYERIRSGKICKEISLSYGFYIPLGKRNVNVSRLKEPDRSRYQIYYTLERIVPKCDNWTDLIKQLETQGIKTEFKHKGQSDEIQGVTFIKNGFRFNGSKVDKKYSYSKISFQLQHNNQLHFSEKQQFSKNVDFQAQKDTFTGFSFGKFNSHVSGSDDESFLMNRRKRKKRRSL